MVLLALLSIISVSAQGVTIIPEEISIKAYAGDFAESSLAIENNMSRRVSVEVSSISGDIRVVIPEIEKGYTRVEPNRTEYLRVRGYIRKESEPGLYEGDVVITVDGKEKRIPIKLEILSVVEDVSLALNIALDKAESKPGGRLVIRSSINNFVRRKTETQLELVLKDPDTEEILVKKVIDITVPSATTSERSTELNIPKDTEDKEYDVEGVLYYTGGGNRTIKATDAGKIRIRRSILDMFDPILAQLTPAKIVLGFFLLIALGVTLSVYGRYRKEQERRKRYLESIKLDALPKKGPRSGLIGKIAEMNVEAYYYMDTLSSHTLIAGTTGCGKTVAAQILVEEALTKSNVSVLVFDPTAQWTGFLEANKDEEMLSKYREYGMKRENAKAFKGNVYVITEVNKGIDPKRHIVPGDITVFHMKDLNNPDMEAFISNAMGDLFDAKLEESSEIKIILVFDEIHRILPKFGGMGKGFVQIERAVREFRRFGIGVILISQVLKDFIGQIKANIGTEVQMQTRYNEDLERINLKYGGYIYQSVVKADIGEGMVQNSEYNKGNPYFISFRPILHSPKRLSTEKLKQYEKYNKKVDELLPRLDTLKNSDIDTFDIELEMNLTLDGIKTGSFGIVDLYIDSLSGRIDDYLERLNTGRITENDRIIKSEWDAKRDEEIKAYERELTAILNKEEKKIEEKEKSLRERQEEAMKNIEEEKRKLKEEEERIMTELKAEEIKLKSKAQVLELLKKHKEIKILREEVALKEKEKLRIGEEKFNELRGMKEKQLDEERKDHLEKEQKVKEEAQRKEAEFRKEEQIIGEQRKMITEDKEIILEKNKEIGAKEEKIAETIVGGIQSGIQKRREIIEQMSKTVEAGEREDLKRSEEELQKRLEAERERRKEETRRKREGIVSEKDRLHDELKEVKTKWKDVLDRESIIKEKEEELKRKAKELQKKAKAEGKEVGEIREEGGWDEFTQMEEEWGMMDDMRAEKEAVEKELKRIRSELRAGISMDAGAEVAPPTEAVPEAVPSVEVEVEGEKPEAEEVVVSDEELSKKIEELRKKKDECEKEIEEEKKRISDLESKGEGWEVFEQMEQEWKRMDELRVRRDSIEKELKEAEGKSGK